MLIFSLVLQGLAFWVSILVRLTPSLSLVSYPSCRTEDGR